jgi:hypothetical protein
MSASELEAIINRAKLLPPDELVELIKQVAEILEQKQPSHSTNYSARFGSGKGAFKTAVEADEFLRRERDEWRR